MHKICFFILLFSTISYAKDRATTVCYFSLNNEKEFESMGKFADQLNKKTGTKISVKEFMTYDTDPSKEFEKMVASGTKCDGLIISGHHTGAFGGKRAQNSLKVEFLEKISCDPKYKEWFKNVKALWLQGCRTLGVGTIAPQEVENENFSPDFHTRRVNRVLQEDHLEQGFEDLNMEFTNTLSQDNPLSERYLRTFPKATVFGWTRTAPGERSKSELSLLYHIAHMANVNNYLSRDVMVNPVNELSNQSAMELANATLDILQKNDRDRCEETAITAWKNHGTPIKNKGYGFNNPDLNAHKSFEATNDPLMIKAKELGCKLKFPKDDAERVDTLKQILSEKKLIAANFNSLVELLQDPDYLDAKQKTEIVSLIYESEQLQSFMGDKIHSKQVGLLAKIDYYSFYKNAFGKSSPDIEKIIDENAMKILKMREPKDVHSAEYYDVVDLKYTLAISLGKNNYPDKSFIHKLLLDDNADTTYIAIRLINESGNNSKMKNLETVFEDILDQKTTDRALATNVLVAGWQNDAVKHYDSLVLKIANKYKITNEVLGSISYEKLNQPFETINNLIRLADSKDSLNQISYSIEGLKITDLEKQNLRSEIKAREQNLP